MNSIFKENYKAASVKPLYRVKFNIKPKKINDKSNLVGNVSVNASDKKTYSNVKFNDIQKYRILPGGCEVLQHYDVKYDLEDYFNNMPENQKNENSVNDSEIKPTIQLHATSNATIHNSATEKKLIKENVGPIIQPPEKWLRVYPAPATPGESAASVAFRCFTCQLGLTACLVLWTLIWIFIIQYNEGPYEIEVMENFSKEQDQLVIDLATELRQITPISMKWREAIINRIDLARRETMKAAGQGAKLDPGLYWDLSGTFLFTIYVMTALVMNAATCAVAHISHALARCKKNLHGKPDPMRSYDRRTINKDSPNCSVNSDGKTTWRRRKFYRFVSMLTVGYCVPLALVTYYATGVLIFGVLRKTKLSDIMLFPIQFTTGGGLASVESHFRILYGFYVEGAMALLSGFLTTIRRYSGRSVNNMAVKYRLFAFEEVGQ